MPNVQVIDGDAPGPDNRSAGGVGTYSATTDATNGIAEVTITVSMQPGDNFRAAASVKSGAAVGTTQAEADANTPPDFVKFSQMLTVWRKLWIERHTMAAPDPTELRSTGTIVSVQANAPAIGQTTLVLADTVQFNDDLNNYEEGVIIITNCPSNADTFPVVGSSGSTVEVLGLPGACAVNSGFTLNDDDDLSALGTLQNPRFPDGGTLLSDAFKPAYISPVYAGAPYDDVVSFEDYLNAFEIDFGVGTWNEPRGLTSSSDFWAWLLVGAWEGSDDIFELNRDADGDPDFCFNLFNPPIARPGAESPLTGVTDNDSDKTSLVFFQAIADEQACVDTTDEAHNVVHELGHAHSGHADGGIMTEGAPKNQNAFTAESLKKFRMPDAW